MNDDTPRLHYSNCSRASLALIYVSLIWCSFVAASAVDGGGGGGVVLVVVELLNRSFLVAAIGLVFETFFTGAIISGTWHSSRAARTAVLFYLYLHYFPW